MDPSSLLHPSLTNPAGVPIRSPDQASQALQLNWPDKAFCSVVAPSPHRAHSWCWEFLPGTSKRAGLNSSFEARPRSLSLGERRSHENSSETSAASKHSCLPWELRSALQTHLPPAPAKQWRPRELTLPEMRGGPVPCVPAAQCSDTSPSYSTSHPSPSFCAYCHKSCASPKALPE